MENRLASLRRILRIYGNWLTVKLIGKDLVSKEDLAELKKYGKLPSGDEVDLIGRAFSLGRAASLSKKSAYKELTLEKLSTINRFRHTSEDSLAVREAKLHAARHLQSAVDDAAAGAFMRLNEATQDMLSDAVVKEIIKDEVALALKEKKTRDQLASSLSNKLSKNLTRDVKKIAVTEMHRAKQRGAAMAIANKVDIYSKSDGPGSEVSVVPNSGACDDCKNLYLDKDGNPKVFILSDLIARGSNADPGTNHKVGPRGLRSGWKPVLPPAHPHCYCELIYLPPGMAWQNGRLKIADELRYKNSMSKAVDTGTMSATIKPKGPNSTNGPKVANPGSMPGLAAPGNEPGPGAPESGAPTLPAPAPAPASDDAATTPAPQMGSSEAPSGQPWVYWESIRGSRTGDPNVSEGWEQSPNGAWRIDPALLGGGGGDEGGGEGGKQEAPPLNTSFVQARKWAEKPHTPEELREYLTEGEVTLSENLKTREKSGGDATPGINTSYEEVIQGNGSKLTKPGNDVAGSDVNREIGFYEMTAMFGSTICPMTVSSTRQGVYSSGQAWLPNHTNAMKAVEKLDRKMTPFTPTDRPGKQHKLLMEVSKDPKKLSAKLQEIATWDMVTNNRDRHVDNFMVNEDFTDVKAIDHGFCYTTGLQAYKGMIHQGFHSNHAKVKLSPALQAQFENTSFGDMQRGFGRSLAEWQTAQTYLRMKYVLKVAEENNGTLPFYEFHEDTTKQDINNRETPNEKWEDFAMDFIDQHSADPSSPEYATAKRFAEIGIFASYESSAVSETGVTVNTLGRLRYEKIVRRHRGLAEEKRSGNISTPTKAAKIRQDRIDSQIAKINEAHELFDVVNEEYYQAMEAENDYLYEISKEEEGTLADTLKREQEVLNSPEYKKLRSKHQKAEAKVQAEKENISVLEKQLEGLYALATPEYVPEGKEAIFEDLDSRISALESGSLPKKAPKAESNMERTVTRMAADIEREKQRADLEGLGFGNRKKKRP